MPYYKVTVQRGHQGSGRFIPITFVFNASNIHSAIQKAKRMPGVKHNKRILSAEQISKEEYIKLSARSAYDEEERGG